ncbi:MAG: hypothetical protein ACQGVC_09710 [Myxococcota bacterium]
MTSIIRFGFFALAAALVVAGVTFWGTVPPAAAPADRTALAPPEEAGDAAVPAREVPPVPGAPPAAKPPPPAVEPVTAPAPPEPVVAEPVLDEEPVDLVPRGAFAEAADAPDTPDAERADPWIEASVAETPEEGGEPAAEAAEAAPEPVDVDRAGDLVRRMLALYDAMRE